jgi:hypothetical protein
VESQVENVDEWVLGNTWDAGEVGTIVFMLYLCWF